MGTTVMTLPTGDGDADQVLETDGSGTISWTDVSGGISGLTGLVEDNSIWLGSDPSGTTDTAAYNVALGTTALDSITTGDGNSVLGYAAGTAITTGLYNTAIGYNALTSGESGYTIAVGAGAGYSHAGGDGCVMVGYNAGYAAAATTNSIFIGSNAGDSTTATTAASVYIGFDSGHTNISGTNNTAVGYSALKVNTATANTAFGYNAGANITSGIQNCMMGKSTSASAADGNYQVVLGTNQTGIADSTCTIGQNGNSASIALDGSDTSWAAASDIRLKDNVEDSLAGLDFINELRPITYKWKAKKDVPQDMAEYEDSDEPCKGTGKTNHGFVAQEVKAIIDKYDSVKDGHNIWMEADSGTQNVAPSALVPMLVKAVQELSAEVEELKKGK